MDDYPEAPVSESGDMDDCLEAPVNESGDISEYLEASVGVYRDMSEYLEESVGVYRDVSKYLEVSVDVYSDMVKCLEGMDTGVARCALDHVEPLRWSGSSKVVAAIWRFMERSMFRGFKFWFKRKKSQDSRIPGYKNDVRGPLG